MPHFRTWDNIYYYDYQGGGTAVNAPTIGVGETQTDVALRAANYKIGDLL